MVSSVLNDVVLNQVLVRFDDPSGASEAGDARTLAVIDAVQRDGSIWLGGTTWHGMRAMRISVSNWATTGEHADLVVELLRRVAREVPTG